MTGSLGPSSDAFTRSKGRASLAAPSLVGRADTWGTVALIAALAALGAVSVNATFLSLVTIALVWLAVNAPWNLVVGFSGLFSFGQVALFAVGAYTAGILNHHLGLPPWASTLLAPLGGAVAAAILGVASVKSRGVYVALVTLSFHELLRTLVSTDYSGLTGGPNGLATERYLPGASLIAQARMDFFAALAIAAVALALVLALLRAPVGLALVAGRDAAAVATARGVPLLRLRLLAFVLSGSVAALAGGFYAHYVGVVAPTIISFALVMNLFAMLVVGGLGSYWGPVLGTAMMSLLTTYFQGAIPQHQGLVVAAILLVMILFLPHGLVGLARSVTARLLSQRKRS